MVNGDFPNLLKIAPITAIPKTHIPKSYYRPISILPTLSTVFAKLIYSRFQHQDTTRVTTQPNLT